MQDFHGYMPGTTDPASFNAGVTADDQDVPPYPSQTHQVPTPWPNWDARSWRNPSILMDPYDSSCVSFDHECLAPSFPILPAVPVTYEPSFSLHGTYPPVNSYYLSPAVGPFETQNAREHRPTHLMPTAPDFQIVKYPDPPPVQPARDSPSYAAQDNFGNPANATSANPWIGHENTVAGREIDYTNGHRIDTANSQKLLKTTRLGRTLILYFDREGKKIWMLQELLDLGRRPNEEGLEGPVTFSSPAYKRVTCRGKECLPSARNQRERNNFLRGQLKWIGDCAHKPSFKFEGKRPSVILSHLVKESCTLHTTHPDLVRYAEWCRAL